MPSSDCADPLLPPECEATPPASQSACAKANVTCWYGDGTICNCSDCEGGSQYPICTQIDPPEWWCGALAQGCPVNIPDAGSACSQEGQQCGPSCELPVVCEKGVWVWYQPNCPICASPSTPVATPDGDRPMADLRAGDLVFSVDKEAIVVVPILRADSTKVNRHHVVRVALDTGAVLEISPGHPTADGRTFADLTAGGTLDGNQRIVAVDLVPYQHDRTYDILPASDTGSYFVAGARIGSTLRPAERR